MSADSSHPYLILTDELLTGKITEEDLPAAATRLPQLTPERLASLAEHAERFASNEPRRGWAIAQVARDASVSQGYDLFLQSLAAWYLGRACNHWTQPKRVSKAISFARRGFEAIGETGWVAACEWQLNHLAWTRPDFAGAVRSLHHALEGLERAGLTEFVPDCRLALAYAQILIGDHESALQNIKHSEEEYVARADRLNQARCWLHRASSLRRRDQFEESFDQLKRALDVFEEEDAIADQAKAHYQMGLGHLLKADDLSQAVSRFEKASELFQVTDLDLWHGMAINNLGSVYLFTGELAFADRYYREARDIFITHEVSGLAADNLNDHGEVNILRGKPHVSVEQFRQAIAINEKLGSQLSAAVVVTNLGKAYGQNGRYQDALFYLEQAAERLEALQSHLRLGTCEKYAALVWSQLGQPAMTHEHLDRAASEYDAADQKALVSEIHSIRATAFFQQGQEQDAIDCLEAALAISTSYGVRPQTALARRLLGEALVRTGQYEEALMHLRRAQEEFSEMGMSMDLAAALVAAGTCHVLSGDPEAAHKAFEQALEWSEGVLPEIEWRAQVGLGDLAASHSQFGEALIAYRQAMEAFARIRQNFWQPALAGSYLQRPSRVFDRIVSLASRAQAAEDALLFIEVSKASTLPGQLLSSSLSRKDPNSQGLNDLESEILFLQDQLRTSLDMPFPAQVGSDTRQIRARLSEKTKQYEGLKARLERKVSAGESAVATALVPFDLSLFRELADRVLHKNWIALDYHLMDDRLLIVVLTSGHCEVLETPVSQRFRMALEACTRAGQTAEPPTPSDLHVLGGVLIPAWLAEQITPDTFLLLSPHKDLHAVPWPALYPAQAAKPLAHLSIPAVVPSLQSLRILWQRNKTDTTPERGNGLVLGLSSFGGRRRELPYVRDEVSFLSSHLGGAGHCLMETEATWENLLRLNLGMAGGVDPGLSRFTWLHIATHFFVHARTGRLSGLALWDGDVWLDKLRDLAPLPRMVTLSACNSISSFVYEGDEHMDLPTTFLIAGADCVIGSLWPILDETAAEFTSRFYIHYFNGLSPARSLVQTQREWMDRGEPVGPWMSFLCVGAP